MTPAREPGEQLCLLQSGGGAGPQKDGGVAGASAAPDTGLLVCRLWMSITFKAGIKHLMEKHTAVGVVHVFDSACCFAYAILRCRLIWSD
jgi:hypothetical protein